MSLRQVAQLLFLIRSLDIAADMHFTLWRSNMVPRRWTGEGQGGSTEVGITEVGITEVGITEVGFSERLSCPYTVVGEAEHRHQVDRRPTTRPKPLRQSNLSIFRIL